MDGQVMRVGKPVEMVAGLKAQAEAKPALKSSSVAIDRPVRLTRVLHVLPAATVMVQVGQTLWRRVQRSRAVQALERSPWPSTLLTKPWLRCRFSQLATH